MSERNTVLTVAFKCRDQQAAGDFWRQISTQFAFCADDASIPVQAFAVSRGDLFAEQTAVEAILADRELDSWDKIEAIGEVIGSPDPDVVLREWEVEALV